MHTTQHASPTEVTPLSVQRRTEGLANRAQCSVTEQYVEWPVLSVTIEDVPAALSLGV